MKQIIIIFTLIFFSSVIFAQNVYISDVYSKKVPHVDKNGNLLTVYSNTKSFLPIAMWGAPANGETYGKTYDWKELKNAGFNTVWPWPQGSRINELNMGKDFDMQIVLMHGINDEDLKQINNHPNLLGNVWTDEPIGRLGSADMDKLFDNFIQYKKNAKKLAPNLKVFINDAPWIQEPATEWWIKWNNAGDFSCHDSYPIYNTDQAAKSIALGHNTPASVDLAVSSGKEKLPVWLIVGAFTEPKDFGKPYAFRHPTPNQLRSCVYTGIEHGVTGVIFFSWDSFITREGNVIGMSPNPEIDMGNGDPKYTIAKPLDLVNAKANWLATCEINKELNELKPIILSPTVTNFKFDATIDGQSITETPIHCMLKSDGYGGYVLFSTNVDASWLSVKYDFEKNITSAETMFENQKPLSVTDNSFTISYEPFETHIIHIKN